MVKTVRVVVIVAAILGIAWLSGCDLLGLVSGGSQGGIEVLRSDKSRETAPQVTADELGELVLGNSEFALDLYHALSAERGNLFFSPYSISIALAMTYAGARGETAAQMAAALHFTLPGERLHPAFNYLDLALASRGQGIEEGGRPFLLRTANSLWGQRGHPFLQGFLDILAVNYGAGLRLLDFVSAPEAARLAINEWVSEQTEGRITNLLPPGSITPLTRLVLTDAIYFSASWHHPFDEAETREEAFHLLDGGEVTVEMMHQTETFGYARGDGYQAVELPYRGRDEHSVELSMVILLPGAGRFAEFEEALNYDRLEEILSRLVPREIELSMPKFSYSSGFSLKEALSGLGMPLAFSEDADFSGMDGMRDLFIGDVHHKAFIAVDEAGTEAAAATAVTMFLTAAPLPPLEVKIDRPFIFLIRDIETGAILFLGRVLNPLG